MCLFPFISKKFEGSVKRKSQGPLNGGVSNGGVSRSGLVLPLLSFFVLFGTFPIFLGFSRFARGTVRGFSRFVLFLFLGLLRAPTRNSPERVRDTIWTFPQQSGKRPGLETPRFSFSQVKRKSLAYFSALPRLFQQSKSWRVFASFGRSSGELFGVKKMPKPFILFIEGLKTSENSWEGFG